jgi:hypothetical protein
MVEFPSSFPVAAIAGIAAGVIVLVCIGAFFIYRRRRRQQGVSMKPKIDLDGDHQGESYIGCASDLQFTPTSRRQTITLYFPQQFGIYFLESGAIPPSTILEHFDFEPACDCAHT